MWLTGKEVEKANSGLVGADSDLEVCVLDGRARLHDELERQPDRGRGDLG